MTITDSEALTVTNAPAGHLYLASVDTSYLPDSARRVPGVYLAGRAGYDWFVILPPTDTSGWELVTSRVSQAIKEAYPDRRGWWVAAPGAISTLIEEVPVPPSQPSLAEVRTQLASSQQALREAVQEHEAFKETVVEVGLRYAERHGWCETYDTMMKEIGLPPRSREWRVEVNVTTRMYVTVEATDEDEATDVVNNTPLRTYMRVPDPWDGDLTLQQTEVYVPDAVEVEVQEVVAND